MGFPRSLLDLPPQLDPTTERLLIRRHHTDPRFQELRISIRNILVAGVVDENTSSSGFRQKVKRIVNAESGRGGI